MTCPNGPGLYSSSLSCRRPDLWAGLLSLSLAACRWLRDGSFSAFDAVVAALMGSAVWAERQQIPSKSGTGKSKCFSKSPDFYPKNNNNKKIHVKDEHPLWIFCVITRCRKVSSFQLLTWGAAAVSIFTRWVWTFLPWPVSENNYGILQRRMLWITTFPVTQWLHVSPGYI